MTFIIDSYKYAGDTRLITKWTLSDPADLVLELWGQTAGTSTYNYDVDWGDGSAVETGITISNKSHTYASTGTYEVKIAGQFAGFQMNRGSAADKAKLVELVQWGSETEINSLYFAFNSCSNMVYTATDAPDISNLSGSTSMQSAFKNCTSITSLDLSSWTNTGNITNMYETFFTLSSCTLLDLTGWNTSNVTTFQSGARSCGTSGGGMKLVMPNLNWSAASSPSNLYQTFIYSVFSEAPVLTGWTLPTAHNVNLGYTFYACDGEFALDLSGWTNTNKITDMNRFTMNCEFTSIDITGWNTSSCTNLAYCFNGMTKLTHITGLNTLNSSGLTNAVGIDSMFRGTSILNFGAAGSVTNFGTNWGANLSTASTVGASFMFHTSGISVVGGATPPDVSNWDMSGIVKCYQMFLDTEWNAALDFSNWDLSGLTASNGLDYFLYYNEGTAVVDFTNADLPSTLTSFIYVFAYSEVTTVTWGSGCDFSNITTLNYHAYSADITSYSFPTNADFSALAIGTQFLSHSQTMGTSNYDNFLTRMDATWVDPGSFSGTLSMGVSKYTGGGAVATARANLIAAGWTIADDGIA